MEKAAKTYALVLEALSLKHLPRKGWVLRHAPRESVAEHTYGVAFIALLLAKMEELSAKDEALLLKLALLHDLHEARLGDLVPEEKKRVRPDEKGTERRMLSGTHLQKEILTLQMTPRKLVVLAKDADCLDLLFRAVENGGKGNRGMGEFISSACSQIKSRSGKTLARMAMGRGNGKKLADKWQREKNIS